MVANGVHRTVGVRTAPLAVEVGEAVHQHPSAGLLRVLEKQFLAGSLAPAVLAVAEAAGEGGLDTGGEHDGASVAVSFKGGKKGGGEAEVAAHELLRVLRAVDTGQVEYEVGLGAPCVQILRSGVDVVFNTHQRGIIMHTVGFLYRNYTPKFQLSGKLPELVYLNKINGIHAHLKFGLSVFL